MTKKISRTKTKPIITLCSSASFYREVIEIKNELKRLGFRVKVPKSISWMKRSGDFNPATYKTWMSNPNDFKIKTHLTDNHFKKIIASYAILVINNNKHGIDGYIGGAVLMEMTIAYFHKKPIYILNKISKKSNIYEEIMAVKPIVIEGDLTKIKKSLYFNIKRALRKCGGGCARSLRSGA